MKKLVSGTLFGMASTLHPSRCRDAGRSYKNIFKGNPGNSRSETQCSEVGVRNELATERRPRTRGRLSWRCSRLGNRIRSGEQFAESRHSSKTQKSRASYVGCLASRRWYPCVLLAGWSKHDRLGCFAGNRRSTETRRRWWIVLRSMVTLRLEITRGNVSHCFPVGPSIRRFG